MRERSTINFLAETLFACSTKAVSSVRDRCGGIPAAGRAVGPERRARAAKWILAPLYFCGGSQTDPRLRLCGA
jgi:hypothetical protein